MSVAGATGIYDSVQRSSAMAASARRRRMRLLPYVLLAPSLLFLGLFTPLAAALLIAMMINAIFAVHAEHGAWAQNNGYEYPLVLIMAVAAIAFGDGGAAAVDGLFGLSLGGVFGFLGILVGLIGGGAASAIRKPEEEAAAEATSEDEEESRAA